MRAPARLVLGVVAAIVAAGCRTPRTEILVWVSTDMPATGPSSPNHLVITAWQSGQMMHQATWDQGDAGPSLQAGAYVAVLYPGDNGSRSEVTVTVMPFHLGDGCAGGDGCQLYQSSPARAIVNLVPTETLVVRIPLWSTCTGVPCSSVQTCDRGTCVDAHMQGTLLDASTADAVACGSGLRDCSGACVDVTTDMNNCGACGSVCGPMTTCTNGSCVPCTVCSLSCVDLTSDLRHCGSCSTNCQASHTGDRCKNGMCCWMPCP